MPPTLRARREAARSASAVMAVVTVHGGGSRFKQEIVAGEHRLTADEPRSSGGDDTGPSPYDLLLAALGT